MRFFALPIFGGVIMNAHLASNVFPRLKYWTHVHFDIIEDGQNKTSHLLFSFLVRIVLFLHFNGGIYLSTLLIHHFISFKSFE